MKKSINKGSITIVCACVCVRNRRKTFSISYAHFYYLKNVSRLQIRLVFFLQSHHLLVGATQTHSSHFTVQLWLSSVSQKLSLAFKFNMLNELGVLIYQFVVFFSKHSICLCFCLKEFCTLSQKIVLADHFRSKRFKMKGKQHAKRG